MNASPRTAHGIGLATLASGRILDVFFPAPALGPPPVDAGASGLPGVGVVDEVRGTTTEAVDLQIDLEVAPADAADAYLRLHLISHRLITPHGANLDGVFGVLSNVAWTTLGPVAVDDLPAARLRARAAGKVLQVTSVDKFPRMTDYVVPDGVRIADADRVRLGAYLAPGTTVMHEGFVNFNAGTLGASMVEGRISSGVTVGDGSDVGGGASIMGTLSGGGTEVITLGERSLLGANAGLGLPLGDDCVVEAGLYVTGGALVTLPDGDVVKARELAGRDGLLFRRNSVSGAIEVLPRTGTWGGLNAALHAND
jgi:2,3,4,5-tetrahydropyridine-2,6-dicarboxylate N-succinyltransferase